MVLFPFALIWMIIVIVWVVRNESNKPDEERFWVKKGWHPRRPRSPGSGPDRRESRRGATHAQQAAERRDHVGR